jgi:chemotaxis protein MotA
MLSRPGMKHPPSAPGRRALLGFAGVAAVVALAAATGFLEPYSLLITLGGSLAVVRATFSQPRVGAAARAVRAVLAGGDDPEEAQLEALIGRFKSFARIYRVEGAAALDRAAGVETDEFVRLAAERAIDGASPEEVREVLSGEASRLLTERSEARVVVATLGRLLPAFGLIGTLIGLALMLRSLSSLDPAALGPGLAISVMTTLYGAVFANVVVLPIATKLSDDLERRRRSMELTIVGAELLHSRELPTRIERALRSRARLRALEEPNGLVLLTERAA